GCLLTLGASLLNPYGPRVFELFVPYVRSSLAVLGASPPAGQLAIAEWKPTWQALTEPPYSPFWLLALVLLAMASFALRGRRVSLPLVSSAIVLGVLGMLAIRHLLPFAAALVAMIVINDRERRREADVDGEAPVERILDSVVGRIAVSTLVVILGGGLLFSVLTDGFYVGRDLPYRTGVGFDPALVPEGAVRWLATRDSPENVFNNFDSGAYLLYRLYPRYLPYDDARVVDPEHFERTRRAVEDPLAFDRMVTDDAIGTVVLVHPSPESVTLLPRLERDPRWRLVFRDHNSTVHVRTDLPEPSAVRNPPSLPPTEEPLGRAIDGALAHLKLAELPAAELTDAFVSGLLGDIERERQAYVRARSIAPGNRRVRAYFGDDSRM
ncbi:MAG: hypothetical protein R3344_08395, partial [Acidobacteriota bacterium]|nr:hypothetical protein [Acidobacteriota bacterium]